MLFNNTSTIINVNGEIASLILV